MTRSSLQVGMNFYNPYDKDQVLVITFIDRFTVSAKCKQKGKLDTWERIPIDDIQILKS